MKRHLIILAVFLALPIIACQEKKETPVPPFERTETVATKTALSDSFDVVWDRFKKLVYSSTDPATADVIIDCAQHYLTFHSYDAGGDRTSHNAEIRAEFDYSVNETTRPSEIQESFKKPIELYNHFLSLNDPNKKH